MSDARLALLTAIHAHLTADAGVLAALGGPAVFDRPPVGTAYPFVSYGAFTSAALDGDSDTPVEHRLAILAWSGAPGRSEVSRIADAVVAALDDAALAPVGHTLVALRHEGTEVADSTDQRAFRGTIRFRAVTEPIG